MGTVAAAFGLCAYLIMPPASPDRAQIVWNTSASAPVGLYRVRRDRMPQYGDLVLVVPTPRVAEFAAQRGYLARNVPLVKRIAATAGDTVCAMGPDIFIDGRRVAERLSADNKGRMLPAWSGCKSLGRGETFLLMEDVRGSFDGRYFGLVNTSQIIGRLDPIWIR